MLKRAVCSIVITLALSIGGAVKAEEGKDGAEVTASLKAWVNEWKREIPGTGQKTSDNVIVLVGPAVEVEFHDRFVLEASYLMSASDYKFTEAGITSEFDRRDLDLGIGKWINRYVGFFTGYRNSSFKEKETGAKDFSYGLFYSVRGAVPFVGTSSLYGNLTYLSTRFKAEGQAREDAPGWIAEIGGKAVFTEQIAMKLGYKWETTKGEVSQVKDSFRGTTLELTYAF